MGLPVADGVISLRRVQRTSADDRWWCGRSPAIKEMGLPVADGVIALRRVQRTSADDRDGVDGVPNKEDWAYLDSNQGPSDYESPALTD